MSILTDKAVQKFLQQCALRNHGPVAVFDCDGTVIKGDVGEAMLYFQLERFLFRFSPADVWPDHPERERLERLFRSLAAMPANKRNESQEFVHFSDIILDWYFGQINDGKVSKACADIVRLFAGFTLEEVHAIARDSFLNELSSPVTTRQLGRRTLPKGIRYIREAVELLRELQKQGFVIWAVSGSNKWSVEPVFGRLDVPAERVIGIEMIERDGVLTPDAVQPVPIRQDKVAAMQRRIPSVPVFAASDSRNDVPLLLYSSGLKVRINSRGRDAGEFFEAVGHGPDETWVQVERPTLMENSEV